MSGTPRDAGPPDGRAREVAARAHDRNLVVTAGAGSGKTSLLIERLLGLCLGRDVPLSRLAAMTFTEKAAAEMRDRLAASLSAVLGELSGTAPADARVQAALEWILGPVAEGGAGASRAEVRERALRALADLDGGVIGTIHAFCGDLLRRHPRAARLDPAFAVDEGFRTETLFAEEWERFLARELAVGAPTEAAWRRALAVAEPDLVRSVAWEVLGEGGDADVAAGAAVLRALDRLRDEALEALEVAGARDGLNPRFADHAGRVGALLRAFRDGDVAALRAAVESEDRHELLDKAPPKPGKKSADQDDSTAALARARRLVGRLCSVDEDLVATVVALGARAAEATRERMEVEGVVDFGGLLVGARDLLRDHVDIRRQEQARVAMLLLDEFQDTDPLQYEIAFLLAERREGGPRAGAGPWEVPLEPGALFIVGDPKQSIYRFRGADMASFQRAVERVVREGGEELSLTANFRSCAEVLAPVNDLCEEIRREDPPYQPAYQRIEAARADAEAGEARVEVWTVRHDGTLVDEHRAAEAAAIAREVTTWRDEGVIDGWGAVTLLFRAMTSVGIYQRALSDAGVPHVTQGGKGFVDREEVVQAVTLLRCLVAPNDAAALLAVLRSPACGASDTELARFARLVRDTPGLGFSFRSHRALPEGARADVPHVARTLAGLDALADRVAGMPADAALRELMEDGGRVSGDPVRGSRAADGWRPRLVEVNAAAHDGAQRLANLEKLVGRAADLSRAEGLSLPRVAERLHRELSQGAREGESPLADEAVDAVKLMIIHQAKGLEFPVVVLPDVARGDGHRGGSAASVAVRDGIASVVLPGGARNLAAVVAEVEDARHEEAERRRLLYVAMTRAEERLVVVNGNPSPRKDAWPFPAFASAWGYDPTADARSLHGDAVVHRVMDAEPRPSAAADRTRVEALVAAVDAGDEARVRLAAASVGRPRAATDTRADHERRLLREEPAPSDGGVAQGSGPREGTAEQATSVAASPAPRLGGDVARAVGTAVHEALEHWGFVEPDALLAIGRRAARLRAVDLATPEASGDVEAEVVALLTGFAASPLPERLREAKVLARELPFAHGDDALPEGRGGFIDLVLEEAGRVWVVDWKTDRERAPERHRDQLEVYGEAVRRWLELPGRPGLAIVHVGDGDWATLAEPE